MNTEILKMASVQRLTGLLKHRYGKGLEVRLLVDSTISKQNGDGATVSSGDLLIPIQMHGTFLGLARVPSVQDLPATSIHAITEVVRLILEPALYRRYLDAKPVAADVVGESEQIQSGRMQLLNGGRPSFLDSTQPKAILLQSQNPHRINRVATHLHETTERWAMLRYSDMGGFGSVRELEALGKATIYVEDLLQLSPEEIIILESYLKTADSEHHPVIVIGSTRTFAEIESSHAYPVEIMSELERYQLQLDRWPQDENGLKSALELCLQDGPPTH